MAICIYYRLAVTASVDKLMDYMDVMELLLNAPLSAEETAPRHVEERGETSSMTSEVQISRSLTETKDKKLNDILAKYNIVLIAGSQSRLDQTNKERGETLSSAQHCVIRHFE